MLTELQLSSLGVVADASLTLGPGLTALTGETGAGKTMLVAGLGLLLGARADASLVRSGDDKAVVQGRWEVGETTAALVEELGGSLDDGIELVSVRQVTAQGRSRAVIGGASVPVSTASTLLGEIATIHGQSEQLRLSSPERQREILDLFAQPEALPRYRERYVEHQRLAEELDRLRTAALERAREVDMLRHGLAEIAACDPQPGEDEDLAAEAARLADADDLKALAVEVQTALSGSEEDFDVPSAVALIGMARKTLRNLADRDPQAAELSARLDEVGYVIDDLAQEVASYTSDLVSDPIRLAAVADRRGELGQLTRKYGTSIDEVLAWAEDARRRLDELEGVDERIEELSARVTELDRLLDEDAAAITADRVAASARLAEAVAAELQALALASARLGFNVTPAARGPHGVDRIELMFAANPGSPPGPLGKVASGGELSRVRLALEVVLAGAVPGHTFVFDEVDAGVGGAVGLEIGRRLRRLAETSQVIVVTHLAQVAAFAHRHFVISKSSDGEVTTSDVTPLGPKERAVELARMMSGTTDSQAAVKHARELLQLASEPRSLA